MGAKPQSSPGSKDLGKNRSRSIGRTGRDGSKLYQQDTGISIYMSSGRFDMQFCVKRLIEMMTKPRKMGNLRLARLARYLVGTQMLTTQIRSSRVRRYCENSRRLRLGWQRGTLLHTCRAGIPWRTSRGFVGCIRSSAGVESGEAELYGIVDGSARGIFTKHMYEEMGRNINIDVETNSTAAIGMCSRTGVVMTRTHTSSLVVDPRCHT